MDEDVIRSLRDARDLLDVYRERDEARSDCRVLLEVLVERNKTIDNLQQQVKWLLEK